MKKAFTLILTAVLILGIAGMALAEEIGYDYKVAAPSGAPGIALATLAVENPDAYTFVAADTIAAEFANAEADFIIAPINAGAKLYKAGKSTYKLGAVVTWGNLAIASQRENFALEDINGETLTLFGENTINASIVLFVLAENGIEPGSVEYLASAANTQSLLLSDDSAIVVTAEPALTAAKMKNDKVQSFPVNDLYKAVTGYDGFAQAGLFIRAETLNDHPEAVEQFLAMVEDSCGKCETELEAVAEATAALEILPNAQVAAKAIPGCSIRFLSAADARSQVEATAAIDLVQYGGELPADDFYYGVQ